jgi:RimJ/RimL family protein N-acetyltransferase
MAPSRIRRLLRAAERQLRERRQLLIYCCTAEDVRRLPYSSPCRRDAWDDLDYLDAWSYEDHTRDQYLAILRARRAEGTHHLYSAVEDRTLIHYGWLTCPQLRAPDAALGLEFVPPAGSAALWDYFTHPKARGRGLYLESLRQCLHDAIDVDRARHVFIYVYADNTISKHVIEKAGFTYRGSLVRETILGRTRRYATFVDEPLDVRLLDTGGQAEARKETGTMRRVDYEEETQSVGDQRDRGTGDDQLEPRSSGQHPL